MRRFNQPLIHQSFEAIVHFPQAKSEGAGQIALGQRRGLFQDGDQAVLIVGGYWDGGGCFGQGEGGERKKKARSKKASKQASKQGFWARYRPAMTCIALKNGLFDGLPSPALILARRFKAQNQGSQKGSQKGCSITERSLPCSTNRVI